MFYLQYLAGGFRYSWLRGSTVVLLFLLVWMTGAPSVQAQTPLRYPPYSTCSRALDYTLGYVYALSDTRKKCDEARKQIPSDCFPEDQDRCWESVYEAESKLQEYLESTNKAPKERGPAAETEVGEEMKEEHDEAAKAIKTFEICAGNIQREIYRLMKENDTRCQLKTTVARGGISNKAWMESGGVDWETWKSQWFEQVQGIMPGGLYWGTGTADGEVEYEVFNPSTPAGLYPIKIINSTFTGVNADAFGSWILKHLQMLTPPAWPIGSKMPSVRLTGTFHYGKGENKRGKSPSEQMQMEIECPN